MEWENHKREDHAIAKLSIPWGSERRGLTTAGYVSGIDLSNVPGRISFGGFDLIYCYDLYGNFLQVVLDAFLFGAPNRPVIPIFPDWIVLDARPDRSNILN
jgi:hypothetical protein